MNIIRLLRLLIIIFLLPIITACTTGGLKQKDLGNIHNAQIKKEKLELSKKYKYRLDYIINDEIFIYVTFFIKSSSQHLQLLIKNKEIISISKINRREVFYPEIKKCTLFPAHEGLNVQHCLKKFNELVISLDDPQWREGISNLNKSPKNAPDTGKYQTIGMMLVLSPILVPTAILASPFLVVDIISESVTQGNFTLKLGKNNNLKEVLKEIPKDNKSSFNDNGTFYFASGIIIRSPAIGIGFEGESIVWIQRSPSWMCGGGFMFWGNKCVFGKHNDEHF